MKVFHFSDLHFRDNIEEELSPVLRGLIDDLINRINEEDILVFTGDLVHSGSEYSQYESLYENLIYPILTKTKLDAKKIFSIPGNHDVDRSVIKSNEIFYRGLFGRKFNEREFNDFCQGYELDFLNKKFLNYSKFVKKYQINGVKNIYGQGYNIDNNTSLYLLNSALISYGGVGFDAHQEITDNSILMAETRCLTKWLNSTEGKFRILGVHHPISWFNESIVSSLQSIYDRFDIILSGHVHNTALYHRISNTSKTVYAESPPLFTTKVDHIGYSYISIGADIDILYRQFDGKSNFVMGTYFSSNDSGSQLILKKSEQNESDSYGEFLTSRFDSALKCYLGVDPIWVEPKLVKDISITELNHEDNISVTQFLKQIKEIAIVKAPPLHGLTSFGVFCALESHNKGMFHFPIILDSESMPNHKRALIQNIENFSRKYSKSMYDVDLIVLDNWDFCNPNKRRQINELRQALPKAKLIILSNRNETDVIRPEIDSEKFDTAEYFYLSGMDRSQIREFVGQYISFGSLFYQKIAL